jgi:hypothetical protein
MDATLRRFGFIRRRTGEYRLDDNGTCFRPGPPWMVVEIERTGTPADLLRGGLGRPGLWKCTREAGCAKYRFDFPPIELSATREWGDSSEEPDSAFGAVLGWALATKDGTVPAGWKTPPPEEIGLTGCGFIVETDGLARRGQVIHEPQRLALRVPILHRVDPHLPPWRMAWLSSLFEEAQGRWRMVRIGADPASASVAAEVDLSGAPDWLLDSLVTAGRDCLRWAVSWLVSSADLLSDARVESRALQVCAIGGQPRKGV